MADFSTDPQVLMDLLNKILKIIDNYIKKRPDIMTVKEREYLETMKNYIGQGKEPFSSNVKHQYVERLKEYCQLNNIPYTILGANNDSQLFFVRKEDKDAFLKAYSYVQINDPEYARRCTPQQIALNLTNNELEAGTVITPVFSDNYSTFSEVIKTKLFDNGISVSNTNERIALDATCRFNNTGKDLNSFNLEMAVKNTYLFQNHAIIPNAKEYAETYAAQKMYDDSELTKFIRNAKKGNVAILCDIEQKSDIYLKVNPADKTIDAIDCGGKVTQIPINGTEQELKTALFRFTDEIHNMTIVSNNDFKRLKAGTLTDKEIQEICHRPKLSSNSITIHKSQRQLKKVIELVNEKATQMVNPELPPQAKYQQKKEIIVGLLQGKFADTDIQEAIDAFKEQDDALFGENSSQVHDKLLNQVIGNFQNDNGNLYKMDLVPVKEIARIADSKEFCQAKTNELAQKLGAVKDRMSEVKKEIGSADKNANIKEIVAKSDIPEGLKKQLANKNDDVILDTLNQFVRDEKVSEQFKEAGQAALDEYNEYNDNIKDTIEALNEEMDALRAEQDILKYQLDETKSISETIDKDTSIDVDLE